MGDDHDRAGERVDEPLEPREPVGVEVVRRLVEKEQLRLDEQDRRERGARPLPAQSASTGRSSSTSSPRRAHTAPARASKSPPPSARNPASARS